MAHLGLVGCSLLIGSSGLVNAVAGQIITSSNEVALNSRHCWEYTDMGLNFPDSFKHYSLPCLQLGSWPYSWSLFMVDTGYLSYSLGYQPSLT